MEKNSIENIDKKNKFLIDWFSFTSKIHSFDTIVDFLGLQDIKFQDTYGCQGYINRKYFDGINIHFNSHLPGVEGVWVEMSGQGCRNFETFSKKTFDSLFCDIIHSPDSESFNITRIDAAYDDFKGIIPLKKFSKQILSNLFVSKYREKSCHVDISSNWTSCCIYLGSPSSDTRFRIYDKAAERGFDEEKNNGFIWTRWEMQCRHNNAFEFVKAIENNRVGDVFKGVLLNYFRPVQFSSTDSNKRRWKTSRWFDKFVGEVSKISLFSKCTTDYNLAKCEYYVYNQAGNALDTLIKIKGPEQVLQELRDRKPETTPKYQELYNRYLQGKQEPELENIFFDSSELDLTIKDYMHRYSQRNFTIEYFWSKQCKCCEKFHHIYDSEYSFFGKQISFSDIDKYNDYSFLFDFKIIGESDEYMVYIFDNCIRIVRFSDELIICDCCKDKEK